MEMRPLMDLHTHTLASGHAYSTLKENLEEAKKMGLKILGTSEHARMMPGTAPLIYFQNFKVIPTGSAFITELRQTFLMNMVPSMWRNRSYRKWTISSPAFTRHASRTLEL